MNLDVFEQEHRRRRSELGRVEGDRNVLELLTQLVQVDGVEGAVQLRLEGRDHEADVVRLGNPRGLQLQPGFQLGPQPFRKIGRLAAAVTRIRRAREDDAVRDVGDDDAGIAGHRNVKVWSGQEVRLRRTLELMTGSTLAQQARLDRLQEHRSRIPA